MKKLMFLFTILLVGVLAFGQDMERPYVTPDPDATVYEAGKDFEVTDYSTMSIRMNDGTEYVTDMKENRLYRIAEEGEECTEEFEMPDGSTVMVAAGGDHWMWYCMCDNCGLDFMPREFPDVCMYCGTECGNWWQILIWCNCWKVYVQ